MYLPEENEIDWAWLIEQYDWLRVLADCPQDPIWHAEGDVLTHTRMVTEALFGSDQWERWDVVTQTALFWSALLHDVAKPMCTQEENGRIVAPRHAVKGAQLAQAILYQNWDTHLLPVPFDLRQRIVNLVRYHGLPLWFWDKPNLQQAVLKASQRANCQEIADLATADVLGRVADDQDDLLGRIDLFREYCLENDCLKHAYQFPSAHSRFLYFRKDNQHPTYEAYDDTQSEVIILSGLPGAGKDTWLKDHAPDYPVIALDEIRHELGVGPTDNQSPVIVEAKERAKEYLRNHENFIWNATNISRQLRAQLIDLCTDYQAWIRLIYLEAPWSDLLKRNQARDQRLPVDVLYKLAAKLEVPDVTEAQQVEWWVED